MGCLPQAVRLHDVRDAEAVVSVAVRRLGLILTASEREELEAEGLAILCELATPGTPGAWDGRGSFAGFASDRLGKRLITAWHKLGGHSRRRVFGSDGAWTGERAWVSPVVSLDAEMSRSGFDELRLRRAVPDRRVAGPSGS